MEMEGKIKKEGGGQRGEERRGGEKLQEDGGTGAQVGHPIGDDIDICMARTDVSEKENVSKVGALS